MHTVLLTNKSKQIQVLNVGDKDVVVKRTAAVQNKHGQSGTRTTEHRVSSSITLLPGERKRVPGIILKQAAVQRLLEKRVLSMVQVQSGSPASKPAELTVGADAPVKSQSGSHPTVEEGTAEVAEVLKQKRRRK